MLVVRRCAMAEKRICPVCGMQITLALIENCPKCGFFFDEVQDEETIVKLRQKFKENGGQPQERGELFKDFEGPGEETSPTSNKFPVKGITFFFLFGILGLFIGALTAVLILTNNEGKFWNLFLAFLMGLIYDHDFRRLVVRYIFLLIGIINIGLVFLLIVIGKRKGFVVNHKTIKIGAAILTCVLGFIFGFIWISFLLSGLQGLNP
jgi:hypothetical protein